MNRIQLARILGRRRFAMIEGTYSHSNRDDDYEAVVRILGRRGPDACAGGIRR